MCFLVCCRLLSRGSQVLLFSATYDDEVSDFAQKIVPQPRTIIRLEAKEVPVDKIQQFYIQCTDDRNKFDILSEIYAYMSIGQSIIFCQVRLLCQVYLHYVILLNFLCVEKRNSELAGASNARGRSCSLTVAW